MITKILGSGCANCVNLDRVTRGALPTSVLMPRSSRSRTSPRSSVQRDVHPGLVVDDKVLIVGRVPAAAKVRDLLRSLPS